MAPPRTAGNGRRPPEQAASREGRSTRKEVAEEVNEDNETDRMDVDDEVEENDLDPSQGTAIQNVIIGGLLSVR